MSICHEIYHISRKLETLHSALTSEIQDASYFFRMTLNISMRSDGHFWAIVPRNNFTMTKVHGPNASCTALRRSRLWIWLNNRLLASTAAGDDAEAGPHVETVQEMLEKEGGAKWLEMYQRQKRHRSDGIKIVWL